MFRIFHTAIPVYVLLSMIVSCAGTKDQFNPQKKYSAQQLKQDLEIAWTILQKNHPSYDLHTSSDSINAIFERVKASLNDSLSEAEFRLRLSFAVAAIRCGHTSVMASKAYSKFTRNQKVPQFPLSVRVWSDSMVAIQSLAGDSIPIKRGTIIKAIDSIQPSVFIEQMKQYISTDGFSEGYKELQISSTFPSRFRWMYGLSNHYKITYIDSTGKEQTSILPVYNPAKRDTLKMNGNPVVKPPKKKKEDETKYGNFKLEKDKGLAILELNNFSQPGVSNLIKKSFKEIRKTGIKNLIIDLRQNGGGKIENSTLLTRYIADKPFRIADSISAKDLKPAYPAYTENAWIFKYFRWAFAKKLKDGRWHMVQTEGLVHKPKKKNHYEGNLYVITSGLTFSASTLFLSKIYKQPNVTLVGEETGGGARGNSAVFTPKVTLPNTGVRIRIPVFRIVSDVNIPTDGRGFIPDVEVRPDSRSIGMGKDKKMEKTLELIKAKKDQPK